MGNCHIKSKLLHLNKLQLSEFERIYFYKLSFFDQHRLIKFSTLQNILQHLSSCDSLTKIDFISYIEETVKNDELF